METNKSWQLYMYTRPPFTLGLFRMHLSFYELRGRWQARFRARCIGSAAGGLNATRVNDKKERGSTPEKGTDEQIMRLVAAFTPRLTPP